MSRSLFPCRQIGSQSRLYSAEPETGITDPGYRADRENSSSPELASHGRDGSAGDGWRRALPGWEYAFPRDHGSHPDFKTEWWYFTGNLRTDTGERLGYELVFFRQGVRPPADRAPVRSRFVVDDIKLAHFALSDPAASTFLFHQRASRGAFGEAGFSQAGTGPLARIEDWKCEWLPEGGFRVAARMDSASIDLQLLPAKPAVIHGSNGVSQKAAGAGNASHYYSFTRLATTGTITRGGIAAQVAGTSWFDHEWATNQLAADQAGWDWFSLQFDDNSELMLYQLRLRSGGIDPFSHGTLVRPDGSTMPLASGDFTLTPRRTWKSPATGATYPVAWRIEIPRLGLTLDVTTPLENQELTLDPIAYWEGIIDAVGTRGESPVRAVGYLEMTGYATGLPGLTSPAGQGR